MPPRKPMRLIPVNKPRRCTGGSKLALFPEENPLPDSSVYPTSPPSPSPPSPSPPVRRRKIRRKKPIYRTPPLPRRMQVTRGCKLTPFDDSSPEKGSSSVARAPPQADLAISVFVRPPPVADLAISVAGSPPPVAEQPPTLPAPDCSDVLGSGRRTLPKSICPRRVLPSYFYMRSPRDACAAAKAVAEDSHARRLLKEAEAAAADLVPAEEEKKHEGEDPYWEDYEEEYDEPWCR